MSSKDEEAQLMQEFFQRYPDIGKTYNENILPSFNRSSNLAETVRGMITWHNGTIDSLVAKPVKRLLEETLRSPAGMADKKEFKEAAAKFREAMKKSHEKDDGFRKQLKDDNLSGWVFFAGEFLTSMRADMTKMKEEQKKSKDLYLVVLHRYCSSLFNAVRNNTKDEAGVNNLFLSTTEPLVKWVQMMKPASIEAIWGL
jgi:hypothetical protein